MCGKFETLEMNIRHRLELPKSKEVKAVMAGKKRADGTAQGIVKIGHMEEVEIGGGRKRMHFEADESYRVIYEFDTGTLIEVVESFKR